MRTKSIVLLVTYILSAFSFLAVGQEYQIKHDNLEKHVRYLASLELKGRMPGTEGYQKAARYVEKELKLAELGSLENLNGYRNNVPLKKIGFGAEDHIVLKTSSGAVKVLFGDKDLLLTRAGKSLDLKGKPVYLGYGISEPEAGWDDLEGMDVEGKIVIIKYGFPSKQESAGKFPVELKKKYMPGRGEPAKIEKLNKAGAAMILQVASDRLAVRWQFIYHIENTRLVRDSSYEVSPGASVFTMHPDFCKQLFSGEDYQPNDKEASYQRFQLKQAELQVKIAPEAREISTPNIVAAVTGTDPELKDEWIVIGAHLDHVGVTLGQVYPGAVDNATGCAVVLEAAKSFVKNPCKRSIAFVFYTAEESGLLGSTYFVNKGPLANKKIVLNINIDEAGKLNKGLRDISVIGVDRKDPSLKDVLMKVKDNLKDIELSFTMDKGMIEERYAVSDHYPYHVKGIPAVIFYNGPYRENHYPEDTIELVDFSLTHKFARLTQAFAEAVANR